MKEVKFCNIYNGEEFICTNPSTDEEIIEGVKYLMVNKPGSSRKFLMRKDALKKISNSKNIKLPYKL